MSEAEKPLKPESCKICPLYESPEGIVWGEGPIDADSMYVGEAPGGDETAEELYKDPVTQVIKSRRINKPFRGGAGRVLNALFRHAGLDRSKVYMTNAVKCRPTARNALGQTINRTPTETEIRCCARFLVDEIRRVNPNVIVPLGVVPLKVLTGTKKGILNMRSVPIEGNLRTDGLAPRYKVVPNLHPAFVMRQQQYWPMAVFDLSRANAESRYPDIRRREWKYVIHAKLVDVKERLLAEIFRTGMYFHDLETTGLNPKTSTFRCVGLSGNDKEIFCFDWTSDVIELLEQIHGDPKLMTVGQNSEGFDIMYQEEKGFEFNGPSYDTLLGWHLLNPDLPKDLATIGASATDEPNWKDDTMYKAGEDALQVGCCKDVYATARGALDQFGELKQKGLYDLYFDQIMPLQPVLRKMWRRGMRKDLKRAAGWHIVLTKKADEFEQKLKRGLGDATFEVNSPRQLMDLLYTRMGLPVQYKDDRERGKRPSVDADALDALAMISNNPILLLIRTIRTLRKWDSTYIQCDHDEHGFVHGHFSSAKAANGRLNSFNPNMQNFPLWMREILVADSEDEVLISRDWGQIEWRIAMALSGDRNGLDALAAGRDAHKDAYSLAFDVDYETVTKAQRFEAKTYNFGLLYGRGEKSLAAGRPGHPESAIPIERVKDYVQRFFEKFSGYKAYRSQLEQQVKKDYYVSTAWGRRRYWYTYGNMPEAFNFPISGTAAHMMYIVLPQLERELPKGATLRLTIHDEVVVNAPKEQKTLLQTIECMRDIMQQAFAPLTERSLYPDTVRHYYPNGWWCPTECHIGENWKITKGENEADKKIEYALRKQLGVEDAAY